MHTDDDIFAAIADERRQLASILNDFTAEQWETQSLCHAWAVRDVAAHLVSPLVVPMWRFGVAMALARGKFSRANQSVTRQVVRAYGDRLPELLELHADKRFTPPGHGPLAPLTDVVVHGQDILRPLGMQKDVEDERLAAILTFCAESAASNERAFPETPLRWEATDLDWSFGSGATVRGPGIALVLLLNGRRDALADVTGDGAEHLAAHTNRTRG